VNRLKFILVMVVVARKVCACVDQGGGRRLGEIARAQPESKRASFLRDW
jgi:hypothetical protein